MRVFTRQWRRARRGARVWFCESCAQACTSACRAMARRDRDHLAVLRQVPPR